MSFIFQVKGYSCLNMHIDNNMVCFRTNGRCAPIITFLLQSPPGAAVEHLVQAKQQNMSSLYHFQMFYHLLLIIPTLHCADLQLRTGANLKVQCPFSQERHLDYLIHVSPVLFFGSIRPYESKDPQTRLDSKPKACNFFSSQNHRRGPSHGGTHLLLPYLTQLEKGS